MEEKQKKYFTKFNNSIHKEKILAKIMKLNYKILVAHFDNNFEAVRNLEAKRDEIYKKSLEMSEKYVIYCKDMLKQFSLMMKSLKESNLEENKRLIKEIKLVIKFFSKQLSFYSQDFKNLLVASTSCVKNGEVVPFEKLDKKLLRHLTYENAFDVYNNLKVYALLGYEMADIYYRCLLIKHNMPIFMTNNEYNLYKKLLKKDSHEILRTPEFTDIAIMSSKYNKGEMISKKLYEEVFPEFGFKYEDRECETMDVYTLEFSDIYD